MKKDVLRNFAKFTGKHWRRCFPVNFGKFLRTPFLQNTSGRLLLAFVASRVIDSWSDTAHGSEQSFKLPTVNYKALHLGCCSGPKSASES